MGYPLPDPAHPFRRRDGAVADDKVWAGMADITRDELSAILGQVHAEAEAARADNRVLKAEVETALSDHRVELETIRGESQTLGIKVDGALAEVRGALGETAKSIDAVRETLTVSVQGLYENNRLLGERVDTAVAALRDRIDLSDAAQRDRIEQWGSSLENRIAQSDATQRDRIEQWGSSLENRIAQSDATQRDRIEQWSSSLENRIAQSDVAHRDRIEQWGSSLRDLIAQTDAAHRDRTGQSDAAHRDRIESVATRLDGRIDGAVELLRQDIAVARTEAASANAATNERITATEQILLGEIKATRDESRQLADQGRDLLAATAAGLRHSQNLLAVCTTMVVSVLVATVLAVSIHTMIRMDRLIEEMAFLRQNVLQAAVIVPDAPAPPATPADERAAPDAAGNEGPGLAAD